MEITVYNPQKGRLETIDAVFTEENTTWFENCVDDHDVSLITDFAGDILISESGYNYPIRIYSVSRADIAYDQRKAKKLIRLYE
jgi:hypothetical protein